MLPQSFIETLKQHADIVTVIQDYVTLRKAGASYKGLCPFHGEKTPSFHVNREKGFFHCFGCGVGGDVFKFLELHDKLGFNDAVTQLAQRFGLPLPELEQSAEQRASSVERESLLSAHEAATAWFREQLAGAAGSRIRRVVAARGVSDATSEAMALGYAPSGRDSLARALQRKGFAASLLVRGGLAVRREDGQIVDRFRNRLMVPICRDTGAVVAFGGRALEADQQPKYLNSPETPLYAKGRLLYGLHLAKAAIRQRGFAVLVEGYFDWAQLYQAGVQTAVASCGTALTPAQVQHLRRFTDRIILSFDPDAAGQGATVRSCEMLVQEGFEVNVALLPPGEDPDTFVRTRGAAAYMERLTASQPYLEYLLDRTAAGHNLRSDDGRVKFLGEMLPVAARIPDAAARDRFGERLAFKAGVTDEVVRAEIRKAAVQRRIAPPVRTTVDFGQVTKAEKVLIWRLVHDPKDALAALAALDAADLEGLASRSVLDLGRELNENKGFSPAVLFERLNMEEARLVTAIASEIEAPAHDAAECASILKRRRYERERVALQHEIDRVQRHGGDAASGSQIEELLVRKYDLIRRINGLI